MAKQYIDIPQYTTYKEITSKDYSFSATQYKTFCIKNTNTIPISEFLYRDLNRKDLGYEVGSSAYVEKSQYKFIKTKALQPETYLLDINKESIQDIIPSVYVECDLKQGDLLISKDSNVGEIAILDKDYPNTMLCGGIYKLPVIKNKYYLLAFIKSEVFRQQIDFLVPRGSIIRHGKTKFLDCLVPMPNKNTKETILYIELLMQAIVNKEIEIRNKHEKIIKSIQNELENNQKSSVFKFSQPNINEIFELDRLDSSMYSYDFKQKEFLIKNYKYGFDTLSNMGFNGIRGTSLEKNYIKNRIGSDVYKPGFYELIIPTNITKYGTVAKSSYIGTPTKLKTIFQGDIIFGGEGYGKGKSFVVIDDVKNIATNYHGIRIVCSEDIDIKQKIFVKCFLSYLRETGMIDKYGVGGNGGHLAPAYFGLIKIPNFIRDKKLEIVNLYSNSKVSYNIEEWNKYTFLANDNNFNKLAGIYEIDKSIKKLQERLDTAIDDISNDKLVDTVF